MKKYMGRCIVAPIKALDMLKKNFESQYNPSSYEDYKLVQEKSDSYFFSARIVQGFALHPVYSSEYWCHCWLEFDGKVYDLCLQKNHKTPFTKADYYKKYKAVAICKFTEKAYLVLCCGFGEYRFIDPVLAEMNYKTWKEPIKEFEIRADRLNEELNLI